jgi:RES domain-containing protein
MIVWRLAPRRHARNLDGAGNRDRGARWNSGRGHGVVYASLNVATCVLETSSISVRRSGRSSPTI